MALVPLDDYMRAAERLLENHNKEEESSGGAAAGDNEHDKSSAESFCASSSSSCSSVVSQFERRLRRRGRPPVVFVSTEDPSVISRTKERWALDDDDEDDDDAEVGNNNIIERPPDSASSSPSSSPLSLSSGDPSRGWRVLYTDLPRENLPIFGLVGRFGGVNEMLNGLLNLQLAVSLADADDPNSPYNGGGSGAGGVIDAWVGTLASNWCGLIDELRSTVALQAARPYVDIGFRCFQGCED